MNLDGLTDEQRPCVKRISGPLVINAGAGSGKTFTLTQRIAYAMDEDSGPAIRGIDEVCAITFTEKAAQEIKNRVRRTLRAMGRQDQALLVDGAWISTIHGMCSRVLHTHANVLGIDPCFTVLDELSASELRNAALEEALSQDNEVVGMGQYQGLFAEYPVRGAGFGTGIADMLVKMLDACDLLPDGPQSVVLCDSDFDCRRKIRGLIESYEDLRASAEDGGYGAAAAACTASIERLSALQGELGSCASAQEQLLAFASAFECLQEPQKRGSEAFKNAVEAHREVYGDCAASMWIAIGQRNASLLFGLAQDVRNRYRALKEQHGALDQNDLLILCLGLFRKSPDVAQQLARQFKLLMVDEFQDTNKLQIALISCLAQPNRANICTVGDAQQSIYRFRGADVGVYEDYKAGVEALPQGRIEQLTRNFRSDDAVLRFVARIFSRPDAFGDSFLDLSCPEVRKSRYKGGRPRIRLVAVDYAAPAKKPDAVQVEAAEIAAQFHQLAQEGHAAGDMVILLGKMTYAQVYADAVRARGMEAVITGGSLFAAAPEVQVVSCLAQSLVNPSDTASLFSVLSSDMFGIGADDFVDMASVCNASGAYVQRRGIDKAMSMEGKGEPFEGSALLAHACRVMNASRRALAGDPLSQAVMMALGESGWLIRLESEGADGLAKAGNILKAVRMMESIEQRGLGGSAAVAREFAELIGAGPKEAPGTLNAEAGNAVRIMTIHSSKGLEFPVVAVASYDSRGLAPSGLIVEAVGEKVMVSLSPGRSSTAFPLMAKATSAYMKGLMLEYGGESQMPGVDRLLMAPSPAAQRALLANHVQGQDRAELYRKLYVAFTRASECLIVTMRRSVGRKGDYHCEILAETLYDALFGDTQASDIPQTVEYGGIESAEVTHLCVNEEVHVPEPMVQGEEAPMMAVPRFAPLPTPIQPICATPSFFGYTAISPGAEKGEAAMACGLGWDDGDALPDDFGLQEASYCIMERETPRDGASATALGDAFHRAAQYAVEAGVLPDHARVDAYCRSLGVGDSQRLRLDAALESWFNSKLFAGAMQSAYCLAEQPFCIAMGNDYLEGSIDLLCLDAPFGRGSHAVVFDYKTGGSDSETPALLRAKHALQAECYAFALMRRGYQDVELHFVRVEHCLRGTHARDKLETVDYRFCAEDLDWVEADIIKARARANGGKQAL